MSVSPPSSLMTRRPSGKHTPLTKGQVNHKVGYVFLDKMSYYVPNDLHAALQHLSERNGQAMFAVRNVVLRSTRTAHNSAGERIADIIHMTIRTSSISLQTFDLEFHFDSYNWTCPPDLIIIGSPLRPSLRDIGLDDTWNASDRSSLNKVLSRLSRMLQHEERLKVANLQNERIQFEYSTLHEREEMDCGVIESDGPTKVLFAVPFEVSYRANGRDMQTKAAVKVQYTISALVENNVTSVQSNVEFLSEFGYPDIISKLSPIGIDESIHEYIEDVERIITQEFEKRDKALKLRASLIDELAMTFRKHVLECDTERHEYISMLFNTSLETSRTETVCSAIVTVLLTNKFPEEYPKLAFSSPGFPVRVQPSLNLNGCVGGGIGGVGTKDLISETILMPRYSPRWDAKRMVEAIWEFLWTEIPRFHERVLAHPANSVGASGGGSGVVGGGGSGASGIAGNNSSGNLNASSGSLSHSRS